MHLGSKISLIGTNCGGTGLSRPRDESQGRLVTVVCVIQKNDSSDFNGRMKLGQLKLLTNSDPLK